MSLGALFLSFYQCKVTRYHVVAPVLRHIIAVTANSSLINGHGRYVGGPQSELAVINVTQGKRYRMRLIAMTCDPNFLFSIDGHNFTVIEADGVLTEPLVVDELRIFAGQRYSVVLVADKPVDNYWIRSLPSTTNASFEGGTNSAILRYKGASKVDPITTTTAAKNPLKEEDLHPLINPGAPGIPEYGKADINLNLSVANNGGTFYVNGVAFQPPIVPVLLQILSGAQEPSQLLPNGSVIVLEANKVIELTLSTTGLGGPVRVFPYILMNTRPTADMNILPASHTPSWSKLAVSSMAYLTGTEHVHISMPLMSYKARATAPSITPTLFVVMW